MSELSRGVGNVTHVSKSMNDSPLIFHLPDGWGSLAFSQQVLAWFEAHKQHNWFAREAGGQLFATFEGVSMMKIVDVTGPRPTDKRSRNDYRPDRIAERVEIAERFAQGLHFVGDWHTHREWIPRPSSTDEHSIRESVRLSSHDLAGFVLVIVGQADFPAGLHVSFHSKLGSMLLAPAMDPGQSNLDVM
jgi:integrative and conjugative element protein (TIGR02256 family)